MGTAIDTTWTALLRGERKIKATLDAREPVLWRFWDRFPIFRREFQNHGEPEGDQAGHHTGKCLTERELCASECRGIWLA